MSTREDRGSRAPASRPESGATSAAVVANPDSVHAARSVKASVAERDRHTWSIFEDWCAALDQPVLPTSPESLAWFLRAHPAAPGTQRRRIAVIDAAHYRHDLPPPGRAETVRAALDVARAERLHDLTTLIGGIIGRLPESGWPTALFARRDTLMLVLASTGLPSTQIAAVRMCDVTVDLQADALHVETANGAHAVTSPRLVRSGVSPESVYRRWCEVLGHYERYPSNGMLADAIEEVGVTELTGCDRHFNPASEQLLLTPIDRWGHTPLIEAPLTPRAVADIVRMHLNGRGPTHPRHRTRAQRPEPGLAPEPASTTTSFDSGYYERGTLARRQAHDLLCDIESVFADVESRAEKMLNDLLEFLDPDAAGELTDVVE